MQVIVRLKNAPTTPVLGESLAWYLTIHNQARTEHQSAFDIPVTEAITFEDVPQDWFPLSVYILVYWLPGRSQIGTYNSWDPSVAGWMGEVYIPSPGSYYFNCNTLEFELIEEVPELGLRLYTGGNFVVYTGRAQSNSNAFASIMPYLDPSAVVYYWNNVTGLYELVVASTSGIAALRERQDFMGSPAFNAMNTSLEMIMSPANLRANISTGLAKTRYKVSSLGILVMVPYGIYWIEVTQDCIWTYGADAPVPSSVLLYSRDDYNLVAYSGPSQPTEDAFASIEDYLLGALYFDNAAKEWVWVFSGYTMVPNTMYAVWVSQDCVWTFEVEVPLVAGTISRKELEYDEVWGAIPVLDILQGERGLLHVWGRNDTDETQRMGISWTISDPDGIIVQEYSTWEAWPYTGPGSEHGFLASRFNLDKAGTYTLNIGLFMNPEAPEMVDSYYGTLCTVAVVVPEAEFRGFGVTQYTRV